MAFADLVARLMIDNRPFERGLNESKVAADRFAVNVGKSFSSKLGQFFSAGAGIQVGKMALASTVARIKEIGAGAKDLGLTTDEFQKLDFVSKQSGISIANLVTLLKTANADIQTLVANMAGAAPIIQDADIENVNQFSRDVDVLKRRIHARVAKGIGNVTGMTDSSKPMGRRIMEGADFLSHASPFLREGFEAAGGAGSLDVMRADERLSSARYKRYYGDPVRTLQMANQERNLLSQWRAMPEKQQMDLYDPARKDLLQALQKLTEQIDEVNRNIGGGATGSW
jgi:hypothetical protein